MHLATGTDTALQLRLVYRTAAADRVKVVVRLRPAHPHETPGAIASDGTNIVLTRKCAWHVCATVVWSADRFGINVACTELANGFSTVHANHSLSPTALIPDNQCLCALVKERMPEHAWDATSAS